MNRKRIFTILTNNNNYMDKDWKKILGEQIRARRQNLDMTQTELSEATGIDRANISKIEGGRYNVSVDIIGRIAEVLRCEIRLEPAD